MPDSMLGFRLSTQQRHLWLLQQASPAYRAQCALRLDGELDKGILEEALQQTIQRHEILRTTFHRTPGITFPIQVVADHSPASWREIDLRDLSAQQQEHAIEQLFCEERSRPFDFEHGPLLHISLLARSAHEHVVFLSLPTVCADAWTIENLISEISRAYAGCLQRRANLDDVVQYVQFSEWQHDLLESEDAREGKDHWNSQRRTTDVVTLPFEGRFVETTEADDVPHSFPWVLPADLVRKLDQLAQHYDTSIAMCLLACWQTLLGRLTNQHTISIAAVFDGRTVEELHHVLGPFARCLPIQSSLLEHFPFREVLAQLDSAIQEASLWQDYFVENASVEALRDQAALPIGFEFQTWPGQYSAGPVRFLISKRYTWLAALKLKLSGIYQDDVLMLVLDYLPHRFSRAAIEILAGQLRTLLESVVMNPEAHIGALQIVSEDERQQLLVGSNYTQAPYPADQVVHRLFEEQAARTPNRTAVVYERQELTYAELNARANRLAHYLQARGIGPDVLVALYLERSLDMIVAVLGILKAGGAYLPLDLILPAERLAFLLDDARVPVLVTQRRLVDALPAHSAAQVCIDDWDTIAQASPADPPSDVQPDHLAYVIYTSGSTGKPKGVMIPHRGLINYLYWCINAYRVVEGQGTPVHSPLGFDLTITSLFPALLVGQCVTLLPEQEGIEALRSALCESDGFSLVKLTPAHLNLLSQWFSDNRAARRVRAFIIGGEALFGESLAFWQTAAPDTRLINEYGPTETVVGCCVYEVPRGDTISGAVPIGRPIANTQLYLLDDNLQPVPTGVPGELYIGGVGLARGYLNRADLTAERFIPHAFSDIPGARLYKTGDIARYLPTGDLEFLGRNDAQENIRGFRIELGEIEAVLASHPSVREAAVLARQHGFGTKRLLAYVVPERGQTPSTSELRSFLAAKLPHYMVPAAFMLLHSLPLTSNGKVNRQDLPDPDGTRPQLEMAYTAPRTKLEKTLAAIWRDVLGLEQVGSHDNFFDLGGHSFLLIQATGLVQQKLAPEITVIDLFEHPTISTLAQYLATRTASAATADRAIERATKQKIALNRRKQRAKEREKANA